MVSGKECAAQQAENSENSGFVDAAALPEPLASVRRGRPGYSSEQVLAVAVAVFNEQGYDATSVSALALRLGLSKSAMYHHFDSKEQLLQIALERALGSLEEALERAQAQHVRAADQLAGIVRGAIRVLIEELPFVTLLLRVRGNSEVERAAMERRRVFDQRVTAVLRAAQREGQVRTDIDASVSTRLIFGMINSMVEWYKTDAGEDAEQLARDVLAMVLEGLQTPAAPYPLRPSARRADYEC